jgi:hypothetical protein
VVCIKKIHSVLLPFRNCNTYTQIDISMKELPHVCLQGTIKVKEYFHCKVMGVVQLLTKFCTGLNLTLAAL